MKRLILPGIPFALSFALSLSTAGSHCYWQDSGFFLVAVKELGVLYPPGFALYVLLCKAWTLALWFVDFTYAVHMFSAVCAASAAGMLAVAVRDLLRTKGPIFNTTQEEGPLAEWVGASIGCLAASGYTFWAAAILAKVYAFYYLVLTVLIWRMIRADESGKPRDFTIVAALIGLSWQAHPSAALIGLALVLFVAYRRRVVGGKGIAWRTLLAYACATGPIHLLPLFKHAGWSALQFGDPGTLHGFWDYLTGSRFVSQPGVFGLESSRVASVGLYFWEEFLGIGALLVPFGCYRLWQCNRRLLLGLAAWVIPVLVITVLFKLEGQHDFWMVAAWIPLWMAAAVGLSAVDKLREAAVVLALAGTIWAVIANRSDLDQRNYTLAEQLGHLYLDPPEPQGVLSLESDDALSTSLYLHRIRAVRRDVSITSGNLLEGTGGVLSSYPPPPGTVTSRMYYESSIGDNWVRRSGILFEGTGGAGWDAESMRKIETSSPEDLRRQFRRARGQFLDRRPSGLQVYPEPYERRLLRSLLLIRKGRADAEARIGKLQEALRLYESMPPLDPWIADDPSYVYSLAVIRVGLNQYERAEQDFRKALTLDLPPATRAQVYFFMAGLCGNRPEAAEWKAKALASPDLAPLLRSRLEDR